MRFLPVKFARAAVMLANKLAVEGPGSGAGAEALGTGILGAGFAAPPTAAVGRGFTGVPAARGAGAAGVGPVGTRGATGTATGATAGPLAGTKVTGAMTAGVGPGICPA